MIIRKKKIIEENKTIEKKTIDIEVEFQYWYKSQVLENNLEENRYINYRQNNDYLRVYYFYQWCKNNRQNCSEDFEYGFNGRRVFCLKNYLYLYNNREYNEAVHELGDVFLGTGHSNIDRLLCDVFIQLYQLIKLEVEEYIEKNNFKDIVDNLDEEFILS